MSQFQILKLRNFPNLSLSYTVKLCTYLYWFLYLFHFLCVLIFVLFLVLSMLWLNKKRQIYNYLNWMNHILFKSSPLLLCYTHIMKVYLLMYIIILLGTLWDWKKYESIHMQRSIHIYTYALRMYKTGACRILYTLYYRIWIYIGIGLKDRSSRSDRLFFLIYLSDVYGWKIDQWSTF